MQIHNKVFLNFKNNQNFKIILSFFKSSWIFIIFSLLNVLMPIFICMIAATMSKNNFGSFAVIGIGYVTSFQLAYSQIGFTFAVFACFLIFKSKSLCKHKHLNNYNIDFLSEVLFLTFIYGIIMVPLFIGPSFVYSKYANAHQNTIDSLPFAYNFIFSSFGFVLFTTLRSTLILIVHEKKGQTLAIIFEILSIFIILGLASILSFYTNLDNGIGLGIGLSVGTLIATILIFLYCYFKIDFFKVSLNKINFKNAHYILKNTWRQSVITIAIQVFKGIALFSLFIYIPNAIEGVVPLNYQMARLVWYNLLYLIPFLIVGLIDAVNFWFIKNELKVNKQNMIDIILGISAIGLVLTIFIIIALNYVIEPLSSFYVQQNGYSFSLDQFNPNPIITQTPTGISEATKNSIFETFRKKIEASSMLASDKTKILDLLSTNSTFQNVVLNFGLAFFKSDFTTFDATSIKNMLTFPNSWSYFYISIYCVLYPIGMLFNNYLNNITKEKPKVLLLIIAEGIAILFIVLFGVNYQTSDKFYLMDAWSFPLAIIGVIAFIYLALSFFIKLMKFEIKKEQVNYSIV